MDNFQTETEIYLRDYISVVLKRRWTIITFVVVVVTIATIGSLKMIPIYRATTQLLIEKENPNVVTFNEVIGINVSEQDYYQTQYIILKSRSLAAKVVNALHLQDVEEFAGKKKDLTKIPQTDEVVSQLLKSIKVEPIRNTRLVNVSAESKNPELATKIANTLARLYIEQNMEIKLFASRDVLEKLPLSLPEKESNPNEDSKINSIEEKVQFLAERYIEEKESQKAMILAESLPSVLNHPLIKDLKAEYTRIETEFAELSKRYKDKHPKMIGKKAEIETMKAKIKSEIEKIVSSIKAELSGNLKSNNIRVIDSAEVPKRPVKPRVKQNIALAFFLGLFSGTGLAFFLEYLDNTLKNSEEAERYLELPCLGSIPNIRAKEEVDKDKVVLIEPKSNIAEAYRTLRTSILFSSANNSLKSLLITSAEPQAGKTVTVANLAITMAQSNARILLVDADLRRPQIHKVFNIKKSLGLSNFLVGKADLNSIIRDTEIPNLKVILTGIIPPSPAELLGSPRLIELINCVKQEFDFILFDSPPAIAVTDALILANLLDGVILVIRASKTIRDMAQRAKKQLLEAKTKILGTVVNDFNAQKEGYYHYKYYYYYHHKDSDKEMEQMDKIEANL